MDCKRAGRGSARGLASVARGIWIHAATLGRTISVAGPSWRAGCTNHFVSALVRNLFDEFPDRPSGAKGPAFAKYRAHFQGSVAPQSLDQLPDYCHRHSDN